MTTKAPAQRRQRRTKGGRTARHTVRFTEDDAAVIADKAAARGLSVSHFLAGAALGAPPVNRTVVTIELIGLRAALRRIGNNVNQLAHAANIGQQVDGRDITEAVALFDELSAQWLDLIDAHLDKLA